MAASFRHLTSRALDPFPHHHNVIANTVTPPGRHPSSARRPRPLPARPRRLGARHRRDAPPALHAARGAVATRPQGRLGDRRHQRRGRRRVLPATQRDRRRPPELEDEIGRGATPTRSSTSSCAPDQPRTTPLPTSSWTTGVGGPRPSVSTATPSTHAADGQRSRPSHDPAVLFASVAAADGICAGGSVFSRADALAALANHPVPGPTVAPSRCCAAPLVSRS